MNYQTNPHYRKDLAAEIRYLLDYVEEPFLIFRIENNKTKRTLLSILQEHGELQGVDKGPSFGLIVKNKEIADLIENDSLKGIYSLEISRSYIELC